MSPDILSDHVLETYSPAEGDDDLERLRLGVYALIKAQERREPEDLGEDLE